MRLGSLKSLKILLEIPFNYFKQINKFYFIFRKLLLESDFYLRPPKYKNLRAKQILLIPQNKKILLG